MVNSWYMEGDAYWLAGGGWQAQWFLSYCLWWNCFSRASSPKGGALQCPYQSGLDCRGEGGAQPQELENRFCLLPGPGPALKPRASWDLVSSNQACLCLWESSCGDNPGAQGLAVASLLSGTNQRTLGR